MEDYKGCYCGSTLHKIWNIIQHCRCMNIEVVAESTLDSSIWHNRLGHMSVKGMKMLAAKRVLEGLKSIDRGHCENCKQK